MDYSKFLWRLVENLGAVCFYYKADELDHDENLLILFLKNNCPVWFFMSCNQIFLEGNSGQLFIETFVFSITFNTE